MERSIDREKVIRGLECCGTESASDCHGDCPYDGDGICIAFLCQEALALLKEQDERIKKYEKAILDYEDKLGILDP